MFRAARQKFFSSATKILTPKRPSISPSPARGIHQSVRVCPWLTRGHKLTLVGDTIQHGKRPVSISAQYQGVLEDQDDRLLVKTESEHLCLPFLWLRDHCRCTSCYNISTNQKNLPIQSHDKNIRPTDVHLMGDLLSLTWPDGHMTTYNLPWLEHNSYPGPKTEKVTRYLWDACAIKEESVSSIEFQRLIKEEEGLAELLHSLLKYGFGLVDGVPADLEGTRQAAQRVCFIQQTLFGGMWSFTADAGRGDTAFTNVALGPHTDGTYYSCPEGIQVFHCVYHDGSGGETLLVDGFQAAENLRAEEPEAFKTLCTYQLEHEYVEPGHHLKSLETVLKVHPVHGQLEMIRYNQYDRASLKTVPPEHVQAVYSALGSLGRRLESPEALYWLKLKPGTVLFVDNWRVLHGRAAFTGNRRINGCYLPRDDWISQARHRGLVWK